NAGLDLDRELTDDAVECYRACFGKVCEFWRRCDGWLMPLSSGSSVEILGRLWINHNCVCLPNGIHCPFVLRWAPGKGWMRTTRYGERPYWGGGLTEFLCQSLARVYLSDVMLRVKQEMNGRPVLLVHDEFVYMVYEDLAESFLQWLLAFMSETPQWWWPNG